MPIYVYKCTSGHEYERRQGFSASPTEMCPTCNSEARRKLFSPAVIYKGTGFYTTDYARKKMVPAGETDSSPSNTGSEESRSSADEQDRSSSASDKSSAGDGSSASTKVETSTE